MTRKTKSKRLGKDEFWCVYVDGKPTWQHIKSANAIMYLFSSKKYFNKIQDIRRVRIVEVR